MKATHLLRPLALASLLPFCTLPAGCGRGDPTSDPTAPGVESDPHSVTPGVVLNEDFTDRQIFPPDNWWNLEVTQAPVDPRSQELIDWISGRTPEDPDAVARLHPDFGPPPYGMPYIGVSGTQPLEPVTFVIYPEESDPGAPG
ncbi:MAG: hypothetical protein QUU85_12340, partial [Candidatus Eisenbacteria bacterium]|nr:hypothetical protein [Candidatus Eisenbacteria bacterium]